MPRSPRRSFRSPGDISQRPSTVSAIKVDGKRAYALAREGIEVELKERAVTVSAFEVLAGAARLARRRHPRRGCRRARRMLVGHLHPRPRSRPRCRARRRRSPHRAAAHPHRTVRASPRPVPIDDAPAVIPPQDAAARLFPSLTLDAAQAADLANGKRVALTRRWWATPDSPGPVAALAHDGTLDRTHRYRGRAGPRARELPDRQRPDREQPKPVIPWFEYLHVGVAMAAGLFCLVMGLAGRKPNDFTLGATALVEVLLIATVVIALLSPAFGNLPSGSGLEFWVYLISAVLVPPAAAIWAPRRSHPMEHGHPRRRVPRDRGDGLPHGPDLVRAGRVTAGSGGGAQGPRAHLELTAMSGTGSSRAVGVGRVLIVVYAILALGATARSIYQIAVEVRRGPARVHALGDRGRRLHPRDDRAHRPRPGLVPRRVGDDLVRTARRARRRHPEPHPPRAVPATTRCGRSSGAATCSSRSCCRSSACCGCARGARRASRRRGDRDAHLHVARRPARRLRPVRRHHRQVRRRAHRPSGRDRPAHRPGEGARHPVGGADLRSQPAQPASARSSARRRS